MIKNYSLDKFSHAPVYSPETKKHSYHVSIQDTPPIYCIEKSRTMSQKKLSITSSPVNEDRPKEKPQIRFAQPNTSEVSRFYKNPSKTSLLLHSKKASNFQDGKVSLKTSNYGFPSKQTSDRDNIGQLEKYKNEVNEKLRNLMAKAEKQRESQEIQIRILKQKIQKMEKQLFIKEQTIKTLSQKPLSPKEEPQKISNQNTELFSKKLFDVDAVLRSFSSSSIEQQKIIDEKLEKINSRFLHYIVLKKEVSEKIQKTNLKLKQLQEWAIEKLKNFETKIQQRENLKALAKLRTTENILNSLKTEVMKIQEQSLCTKSTIGGAQNWESFEDYHESNELTNTSTISYGGADIFFYPAFANKQETADSFCGTTTVDSKESSTFSESSTFKLQMIVNKLIGEFQTQLPLECWMDKFSRLVPKSLNKPLRNNEEEYYFKLTDKQAEFLQRGQYVKFVTACDNEQRNKTTQFYPF